MPFAGSAFRECVEREAETQWDTTPFGGDYNLVGSLLV